MKTTSLKSKDALDPTETDLGDIQQKDALVRVRRTWFNQETDEDRYLMVRPFVTTPAQVTTALSRTINLGNYESAKISVSVTCPCYKEEIADIVKKVHQFVSAELDEQVSRLEADLKRF